MTVTDLVELDKKRCKVYLDGEFAFVLYKGELRDHGIKQNAEVDDESYRAITEELLPKRATKRAMNLLQKKDYTEKKLRDKLAEGMYSDECIDAAIEYVKSYRYLDDERFARDYIVYHMEMRSKNRIVHDLMDKGISKELTERLMLEIYEDEADVDVEQEQIKKLLVKKHYDKDMEFKDKQKIIAFLLRRGYSMDSVRRALDE
ncbi:regulatory protein RecX [Butyrivibrio sp. DSM 10294]|uniref:regulatory protein RecX n=1 Tax=Butyrivibrio sp. DSM 10294 TaxID=2972457 RepID=UPI00234E7C11|nr:regulatory protein RecX [Butyrivibrio sp. DSM 10294]MDC7293973.1 regulatory protein RecX [Butyrivibrio sp. DSM 10294]